MNKDDDLIFEYITNANEQVSKFVLDERNTKIDTLPNAVVVGDNRQLGVLRVKPQSIPQWLLSHPAVERGIEFKFNRIIRQLDHNDIGNNVIPKDDSKLALKAKEYVTKILKNSHIQPVEWIKQYGKDAMRFGDNYSLLIQNKDGSEVLRWELQHPVFFSPMFDTVGSNTGVSRSRDLNGQVSEVGQFREADNIIYRIDQKTKKPKEYTQLKKTTSSVGGISLGNNKDPKTMHFVPTGKLFPVKRVGHLVFDRIGDEPYGISIAQTLWLTVTNIVRVEVAGSDTMVAFGNNKYKATTPFRSKEKMQQFAKSIEHIKERSVVVLPEGVTLDNMDPVSTEFAKVHDILLTLIAIRLGISKLQLEGTGSDINKSTIVSIIKDSKNDFFADQLTLATGINDLIIKSCKIGFNLRTTKQIEEFPYPIFKFFEIPEETSDLIMMLKDESLIWRNIANAIEIFMEQGFTKQATHIMNDTMNKLIMIKRNQEDYTKRDVDRNNVDDPLDTKKIINDGKDSENETNTNK